jgi:hypothetical protein
MIVLLDLFYLLKEYIFTPAQTLTLRTIGGILDFYFVVDDHPESVLQSYHQVY